MPAINVRDDGRVQRLISLAYILSTRTEIHIEELAERLGIDRAKVEEDLNVLMYCGLPPYSPEQLFDIIIEDDFVSMYFNDVFIAPMRLSEEEKSHVVIALSRLIAQTTDEAEKENISRVAEIIDATHSQIVAIEAPPAQFDSVLRQSVVQQIPIELNYLSLSSASLTSRIVDVQGLFTTASVTYIFAFCHEAKAFRVFRSDRILEARLRSDLHVVVKSEEAYEPLVNESSDETSLYLEQRETFVDLLVDPLASWVLDSYPHEIVDEKEDVYRFFTPSPYFVARLILANSPLIRYSSGSFDREAIVDALDTVHNRMKETSESQSWQ